MGSVSAHGHLQGLAAHVLLLHGAEDSVIPAVETLWLAKDINNHLVNALITPLLTHVDVGRQPPFRERVELVPEKEWSEEIDPETIAGLQPEDPRFHEKNWFDCIRSGKAPNANIDLAVRAQTIICLAEMSQRMNLMCLFDEKTRTIKTGEGRPVAPITYGTLPLS